MSVLFGSEKISCQLQRVIEVDKLSVVDIRTYTLMVEFVEVDICTLTIMHRFNSLNFRNGIFFRPISVNYVVGPCHHWSLVV